MSLQTQLDAFMADVRTKVAADTLASIESFYDGLGANGLPQAVRQGDRMPDFDLPDAVGGRINSASLRARGPVVVAFYRGAWCPFCNLALRALQGALPEFVRHGATLTAISPELPDQSLPLIERERLGFHVLSDHGNLVARQFGLVFSLSGDAKRISHETFGVDLPRFNGDTSWSLPVPATYVVDRSGIVRFAAVDADFRHRPDPTELLAVLAGLHA